jgi:hypothetical protein
MKTLNLALGLGDGMQPAPSDALHQATRAVVSRLRGACVRAEGAPRNAIRRAVSPTSPLARLFQPPPEGYPP